MFKDRKDSDPGCEHAGFCPTSASAAEQDWGSRSVPYLLFQDTSSLSVPEVGKLSVPELGTVPEVQ
jgi:hypothetical protein